MTFKFFGPLLAMFRNQSRKVAYWIMMVDNQQTLESAEKILSDSTCAAKLSGNGPICRLHPHKNSLSASYNWKIRREGSHNRPTKE